MRIVRLIPTLASILLPVAAAASTTATMARGDAAHTTAPVVVIAADTAVLPQQADTELVLRAVDPATSKPVAFSGPLWVDTDDRDHLLLPRNVEMRDGACTVTVFARRRGPATVRVFEPAGGRESVLELGVEGTGVSGEFFFDGFSGRQVVMSGFPLKPNARITGDGVMPRAAHVEVRNRRGKVVLARNLSVMELASNALDHAHRTSRPAPRPTPTRAKVEALVAEADRTIRLHTPGELTVDVTFVAESVHELPQATGHRQSYVGGDPAAPLPPDALATQPDGVTTDTVMGYLVRLEGLPTTATVTGRDRSTLWSFSLTSREALLYPSQFGIGGASLLLMDDAELEQASRGQIAWQRRIGSFWGRNDLWWHEIEPVAGTYLWPRLDKVVEGYRAQHLRLVGTLGNASSWSADGSAPSTPEELAQWRALVRAMAERYQMKLIGYEVWTEPNTGAWAPAPDVAAYRELVKATHEEVRKVSTGPRIVAGVTAGVDTGFLDALLSDGFTQYLDVVSVRPAPGDPRRGPEDNGFDRMCADLRDLMRRHSALTKETWITEIGWPTGPGGSTELEQANWLVRAHTIALANRVDKVFWAQLGDWERFPWQGDARGRRGLLDGQLRPKPAAAAYNLMQYLLTRVEHRETRRQGNAVVHSFAILPQIAKVEGRMHVAWTLEPGAEQVVALKPTVPGALTAIDLLGGEVGPENRDEIARGRAGDTNREFRYRIGFEPVFIWDIGDYTAVREPAQAAGETTAGEETE